MKYDNFIIKNSLESDYLIINFNNIYNPDLIAQNVIQEDCPDFLVPMKILNNNNQFSFCYKFEASKVLSDTAFRIPKKVFIPLFLNIIEPFVSGKDWLLDYHYFCINPEYVLINSEENSVRYIYVPENSMGNTDSDINQFLGNIVDNIELTDDQNFHQQLSDYFKRNHVVLIEVYRMLVKEQEVNQNKLTSERELQRVYIESEKIVQEEKCKAPLTPVGENEKAVHQNMNSYDNSEEDIMRALFGTEKKESPQKNLENIIGHIKKKDNKEEKKKNNENHVITDKIDIQPVETIGRKEKIIKTGITEIYFDNEISNDKYIELIESPIVGAPARISLNFNGNSILIGRISSDERKPDVAFPADFKRIGRRHAMIERKNNEFYLIDLGSANHTLINGRVMEPNKPYLLKNKDEISFTDSMPIRYVTVM